MPNNNNLTQAIQNLIEAILKTLGYGTTKKK